MDTILAYLRQLEANNNKPWFDAHKNEYLQARAHFNIIVEQLIEGIMAFDPTIRGIGIKECTYRINKDMRFSKDGLPYKSHFGAIIARGGDFDRIIKGLHPSLSLDQDQKLKRAPLGFDAEGPYIEYIKLKNFCLSGLYDE